MLHRVSADRRVIYIEDNAANLALVRKILEYGGRYEVVGAPTGERGLEALSSETPCLVLLDLDLPTMDGLEVARRIKADAALADIPIVAISASVMKQERQQAIAAGCVGFIEKPFDIAHLRVIVDQAVAGQLSPHAPT